MIVLAVENNLNVYVYDNNKNLVFEEHGKLVGYTSSTVAIERNKIIYVYSEKKELVFTYPKDIDTTNIIGVME